MVVLRLAHMLQKMLEFDLSTAKLFSYALFVQFPRSALASNSLYFSFYIGCGTELDVKYNSSAWG